VVQYYTLGGELSGYLLLHIHIHAVSAPQPRHGVIEITQWGEGAY
jgi:hypothetical protein